MKGGLSPRNPEQKDWVVGVCVFLICSSAASWPRLMPGVDRLRQPPAYSTWTRAGVSVRLGQFIPGQGGWFYADALGYFAAPQIVPRHWLLPFPGAF